MSALRPHTDSNNKDGSPEKKFAIKRFEFPPQEYEEFDPSSVLALACAAVSMIAKYHLLGWLSLFLSITSIFNNLGKSSLRSSMSTPLQGLMFSILALTTIYTKRFLDPNVAPSK